MTEIIRLPWDDPDSEHIIRALARNPPIEEYKNIAIEVGVWEQDSLAISKPEWRFSVALNEYAYVLMIFTDEAHKDEVRRWLVEGTAEIEKPVKTLIKDIDGITLGGTKRQADGSTIHEN